MAVAERAANDPADSTLWRIDLRCADPDEESWKLIEMGAEAVELLSASEVRCYLTGAIQLAESFQQSAESDGFTVLSCESVERKSYLEGCPELYAAVNIGRFKVLPVRTPDEVAPSESASLDIFIIPGEGWGTGHHPSTHEVLKILQEHQLQPRQVLDFGTGSGILAIACAKLFGAHVFAVDIRAEALANASQNVAINNVDSLVELSTVESAGLPKKVDLIVANVYAEVLIDVEPLFYASLEPGGTLITAGVLTTLSERLLSVYSERWRIADRRKQGEWEEFVFLPIFSG
ncbi:MAG: 50S ribosomal protein L11 methyltransferase [Bdellovibrionota bacterium]